MESDSILIKDATILNPLFNKTKTFKSSILIENNKIVEINENIDFPYDSKIIDAKDKIVLPGLINTHTHLSMSLFRGLADDLELDSWLNDFIWPMESNLNGDFCYIGALLGAIEMIKTGTTTFSDMYFFMEDVAKAVDEAGIRGILSYGMIDFGDSDKRKIEIKNSIDLFKKCNNSAEDRIKVFFGPHSPYTASEELLTEVRKKANKFNTKIHIHVSETKKEIEDSLNNTGKRPFEYLNDIGFLNDDVIAAHCVWLSSDEINLIKENDVKVSHNPCSNMKLASGIAPISKMIKENICVSLGTDGASSNNNLDLIEEMKFASLLQKVDNLNPKILNSNEVLSMATINGAKSLGLDKEIGSIEIGKKADLILINKKDINMTPDSEKLSSNIVYSANGLNVDSTICNGKILMENKELSLLDEKEILSKARLAFEELKSL